MDRLSTFQRHQSTLPGSDIPWLNEHRKNALTAFAACGFPNTSHEEWQHLAASAFSGTQFLPPTGTPESIPLETHTLEECLTVAFANGRRTTENPPPLPEGVEILNLQDAASRYPDLLQPLLDQPDPASTHGLSHLVAALAGEGLFIRIAAGISLDRPIQILNLNSRVAGLSALRHFILLERNAQATVIETHAGFDDTEYLSLSVSRIHLEENASLDHYKHLIEGDQARHFEGIYVDQGPSSRFRQTQAGFGARFARTDIHSKLERASDCELEGAFLAQDQSQIDTHTRLRHSGPHATSRDLYRGIAGGKGRGVFQGRIIVEPGAQKTHAEMQCRNLLLSQDAEIHAKPQLEIYADDVKCSHGLTVGQLDPEAIFYLASRGISEMDARELLTFGFANEIIERVRPKGLRTVLQGSLSTRLAALISKEREA